MAYELEVTRICHTAEQHIDLAHGEDALQAASHDMLDGQRLRLVDLSLGL